MRRLLGQLFREVLTDLAVEPAVRRGMAAFAPGGKVLVIAFGKAARPMATAALRCLPDTELRGLLVPPPGDGAPLDPLEVVPGGHPLPDENSLRAAARALSLCRAVEPDDRVLFLVSGGGSAMLELPADPRANVAELQTLYRALVGCGADITAINTVRRHLSAIKGGRLALAAAAARRQCTLAISDVPGNLPAVLASGPTAPDPTSVRDCRAVISKYGLTEHLPDALRAHLDRDEMPPHLSVDDELNRRCDYHIVLDNEAARTHLMSRAERAGILVREDLSVDDLPYEVAADRLLTALEAMHRAQPQRDVAIITGGELSVTLPENPGIGGRNQQFVLACAHRIADRPIAVLSAGTDGIDGNSPAAGAVADGTTAARARAMGLDVDDHLQRFDAHPLLRVLGDTLTTGPSGQNVRDLRIVVHAGRQRP